MCVTTVINGFYILEIFAKLSQILLLIIFIISLQKNWLTLWEEKPRSIPLYILLHVYDLLCFVCVHANAHFETFLGIEHIATYH